MRTSFSVTCLSHMASLEAPTGAEWSLALLAEGLRNRGHSVSIVVPGPWALSERLRSAGVDVLISPCRVCWLTHYEPVSWPLTAWKWARFAWPDGGGPRLESLLRQRLPDVVHVNCLPHLKGARAARKAGRPVVWHLREILPPGARRRYFASGLGSFSDAIVAVSEAVAGWVREEGLGDRVHVIPNGVEPAPAAPEPNEARRSLGLPVEGCLIGLFGQVVPHKGVREFLRAARIALADEGSLRFAIAGPGPPAFLSSLRREVSEGPRMERFHFLAPQRSSDRLMAAADVVCLSTTTPDPLPRSVLEAMSAGKPVAAFRSGGTDEMVLQDQTGLLAEAGDVEGLAELFVRLARDPGLRRKLGAAAAVRTRESFSLDLHLDRMERLFRQLAER